jgi:hypothetical protein
MTITMAISKEKCFRNEMPSPDRRENPFVPVFGTKDLE